MSVVLTSLPSHAMHTAEGVLAQVNTLVGRLRARAPETERLRRMLLQKPAPSSCDGRLRNLATRLTRTGGLDRR